MAFLNTYLRITITTVLIILLAINSSFSQDVKKHEVSGIVLDKETGDPIPTANVYLSQTTIGSYTKHDGTFEFQTKLSGIHTLVISYIGYKTETRELNFYTNKSPYFEIELSLDPIEMDEVEITASNEEWQDHFNLFKKNFIGETGIAADTEIENPWVIGFEEDEDGNLIAYSQRPIIIINNALGYKLSVDLIEFRWPRNGETGYYLFHSSYKEMDPERGWQRRSWERKRKEVYHGSFEHFLQSLYNDDLKDNDFQVVLADTYNIIDIPTLDSLKRSSLRVLTKADGLSVNEVKAYQIRYPVDVLYGKRWFNTDRERSRITPMQPGGYFVVTNEARLANPVSLRLDGIWSKDRLANLLPTDYKPEE